MILLALQLILAHIIGDFVIHPTKWQEDESERKQRSPFLLRHIAVHALSMAVLLQFDVTFWLGFLVILITHWIIDAIMLNLATKLNERALFILNQVAHLIIIFCVVYLYEPFNFDIYFLYSPIVLLFVIAILLVSVVSSKFMTVLVSRWALNEDQTEDSLENAGKYIGILERLFIFGFIVTNHWQAIGFLLAAKSVFRFGDLSKSKDRKLTEYILIGTLLSFSLAIVTGIAYEYLVSILPK